MYYNTQIHIEKWKTYPSYIIYFRIYKEQKKKKIVKNFY